MEFLTIDEYKSIKNIKSPNQDVEIASLLQAANQFVTEYLGYGDSNDPVEQIVYVESDTELLDNIWNIISSVTTIDGQPLTFSLRKGYILNITPAYQGEVKITGVLKTLSDISAIKLAVQSLADYYMKDQYLKSISSTGGDSISLPTFTSIPPHIKSLLDLYRIG